MFDVAKVRQNSEFVVPFIKFVVPLPQKFIKFVVPFIKFVVPLACNILI